MLLSGQIGQIDIGKYHDSDGDLFQPQNHFNYFQFEYEINHSKTVERQRKKQFGNLLTAARMRLRRDIFFDKLLTTRLMC